MKRRHLLPVPFLAAAALAVGCGGESGSPDADPAAIAPANSALYVEIPLKLDEERSAAVTSLSQKLLGIADPGEELKKLIERESGAKRGESWDKDIAPIVGDRLAFAFTAISENDDDTQVVLIAPTEDPDKAWEELKKPDEGEKLVDRKHKDVEYKLDQNDQTAYAMVDDYALIGDESSVKATIDASEGEALDGVEQFEKSRDQVEDDALGFGYLRFEQLLATAGPEAAAVKPLLDQFGEALALSLDAEKDAIEMEMAVLGAKGGATGTEPGKVLTTLPGDSWLAGGTSDIGGQIEKMLAQFEQLGAFGGVDLEQQLSQIESAFGFDVRKDLIAWMGDGGVFVQGTTLNDIGGGLVVQSKDPAATKAVLPKLEKFARAASESGDARVSALDHEGVDEGFTVRAKDLPLPIHFAAAGDKFIVAVTDKALDAALKPTSVVGDSAGYKAAVQKLGDDVKPSLVVDPAAIATFVKGLGVASGDPDLAKAVEILEKLSTIAAGGATEGDVSRGEVVVGVK